MLYWFFVKGLGPIAIHRMGPTAKGLENIPREAVPLSQPIILPSSMTRCCR